MKEMSQSEKNYFFGITGIQEYNYFIKAGEYYCGDTKKKVATILGSCVSVVFYNQKTNCMAISHGVMPVYNGEKNDFYYVDRAIKNLVNEMKRKGMEKKDITVMIIGGADVLKNDKNIPYVSIGEKNVQSAVNTLKKEGLKISRKITGGPCGRKVVFYPNTGKIIVKNLPSEYNTQYSDLFN